MADKEAVRVFASWPAHTGSFAALVPVAELFAEVVCAAEAAPADRQRRRRRRPRRPVAEAAPPGSQGSPVVADAVPPEAAPVAPRRPSAAATEAFPLEAVLVETVAMTP